MEHTITLSVWPFILGAAYLAGCVTPFLIAGLVTMRRRRQEDRK